MASSKELSGIEKASLLLISMGSKTASDVLKHLSPEEVQRLATQIAHSNDAPPEVQEKVIQEFTQSRGIVGAPGGIAYVKDILEQSLGAIKAGEILESIISGPTGRPFEWAKNVNVAQLSSSLRNERPQVIALVLAHLPANHAADLMAQLNPDMQGNIAFRLTSMRPISPEIVKAVDEIMRDRLSRDRGGALKSVGGLQSLVTILNNADRSTESKILEYLEQTESSIAESVRQLMFVFEDISQLEDRALQTIIRELEQEDLKMSLKGASPALREVFFRNMSERAVEVLKEDLEMMGAVKLKDVEAARRRVIAVVHRLDEMGEISIRPDDEEVVT